MVLFFLRPRDRAGVRRAEKPRDFFQPVGGFLLVSFELRKQTAWVQMEKPKIKL
jgi:hypothetical protein